MDDSRRIGPQGGNRGWTLPRRLPASLALIVALAPAAPAHAAGHVRFGYRRLVVRAKRLAQEPYRLPQPVPKPFRNLPYSQWSRIRFRRTRALWPHRSFRVLPSPAGYLFDRRVRINVVEGGRVREVPFVPAWFRAPMRIPETLGYSGFRVTYPIAGNRWSEVFEFQGASYFRAVPKGGWFGLSARGVAIDTVAAAPEEFPHFSEFWLVRPRARARRIRFYALLRGRSVTGAYRFAVTPGDPTTMRVRATLFLRRRVAQLGLAPLTSMFFYGVGNPRPPQALRPAVHDSDGLLVADGAGGWTWTPLADPPRVRVFRTRVGALRGFGLFQRDRNPRDYLAPAQHEAQRPSAWVAPTGGDWGAGHVVLIELPTNSSYEDNIVAFWEPDRIPGPGVPLRVSYTISWRYRDPVPHPLGRVISTLFGGDARTGASKYVIDYAGGALEGLHRGAPVVGRVRTDPAARVLEDRVEPNPYTGGWRQVIRVLPGAHGPVDLWAELAAGHRALTETWHYRLDRRR